MNKNTLTDKDFIEAGQMLNVKPFLVEAIALTETMNQGFLANGEPQILFERHVFHKLTNGKFDKSHPTLSNAKPGGYGKIAEQHTKLQEAVKLNRTAALMSCSWGRFQVMGYNWDMLGYASLQQFINKMYASEAGHLDAFVRYIKATNLAKPLANEDFKTVARVYNGPNFAKNNYDTKMLVYANTLRLKVYNA